MYFVFQGSFDLWNRSRLQIKITYSFIALFIKSTEFLIFFSIYFTQSACAGFLNLETIHIVFNYSSNVHYLEMNSSQQSHSKIYVLSLELGQCNWYCRNNQRRFDEKVLKKDQLILSAIIYAVRIVDKCVCCYCIVSRVIFRTLLFLLFLSEKYTLVVAITWIWSMG